MPAPVPPLGADGVVAGGPLLAVLIFRRGVPGGGHVALRRPTVRLGREEGNDVTLASASISGSHAELRLRGGVWSLTDLGSMNGSWVDGEPVFGAVPLGPGSSVRLGDVEMVFSPKDRWEDSPRELVLEATPLVPVLGPPLSELRPDDVIAAPPRERFRDEVAPSFILPDSTRSPGPLLYIAIALALAAIAFFLSRAS